ncbi:hypothetical protein [Paenibacillus sp. 2KB_22]|uniref:hypothetical protein n=1 Tax=Paenibacillus sp. 2KB_22 TaxID=3232978 RepID=UPI003F98A7C2
MKFIKEDDDRDILEIEVKSIHVEFEETNSVAHDKYMRLLTEELSEVIDTCIALLVNISLKKQMDSGIYKREIREKLVWEISNTNLDNIELPKVFENDYCQIVLEDIPEKFNKDHLLFGISNPPTKSGGPKDITISEIENTIINLDRVIGKIDTYLASKKVRKKYKIDNSTKVILFILKYPNALGLFANVFNEIRDKKLYEDILKYIGKNICFDDFFDRIIVALEPMEGDSSIYITLNK